MMGLDRCIGGLALLTVPLKDIPEARDLLMSAQAQLRAYRRLLDRDGLSENWEQEEDAEALPFADAEPPGEAAEDFWDDGWPLDGGG